MRRVSNTVIAAQQQTLTCRCCRTDDAGLSQAISLTLKTYGRIDGLILNAGTLDPMGRIDTPENGLDSWKKHFDVNFFSLVSTLKATLPSLRQNEGRVVFVSSGAAVSNTAGWGYVFLYCMHRSINYNSHLALIMPVKLR